MEDTIRRSFPAEGYIGDYLDPKKKKVSRNGRIKTKLYLEILLFGGAELKRSHRRTRRTATGPTMLHNSPDHDP